MTFQRNIATLFEELRGNMLRAFGYPVAKCCEMLGVPEFENGRIFHATFVAVAYVVLVWPGLCNSVAQGRAH